MDWHNAAGLVDDLKYYGDVIQKRAEKKLSKYYPKVKLEGGREVTVLTYIWARTVKCPNPACGCQMPLVKSFALRSKKNPKSYFEAIVKKGNGTGNQISGYKITNVNPGR
jgi:putative DNA methylase